MNKIRVHMIIRPVSVPMPIKKKVLMQILIWYIERSKKKADMMLLTTLVVFLFIEYKKSMNGFNPEIIVWSCKTCFVTGQVNYARI